MLKNELLELLKDISDDADINENIQNIEGFAKPLDINSIGLEDYKKLINEKNEIKGYNQSLIDSAVSKGVESFKTKKMPTYIEEAIKAKSNEGKTPEQIQLAELQKQLDEMKAEKEKVEILNANSGKLKEKGLDIGLAKYINTDEDIEFFNTLITNSVNNSVKERLGNKDQTPPKSTELNEEQLVEQQLQKAMGII